MSFEGYFIFDADNLLNGNYISKMNDAFDSGEKLLLLIVIRRILMKTGLLLLMLFTGLDR